jgi:monofunctional biosynthetic peptidoglycan transglycosylase
MPAALGGNPLGLWRLGRWLLLVSLALLLAPIPLVLMLRVVDPPTTMLMLVRTVERAISGQHPYYPQRQPIPSARMSSWLRRAVVVAEDDRFYRHSGFDFQEIARALEDHEHGKPLRGASTISQQTAKNLFLWEGRSYLRKGLEAYLTVVLETLLGKERILEIYLNLVEWGDGVFGAERAAQTFYGKSAALLTREEAARMAAILPNPRRWKVESAIARRRARTILERLSRQGEG